MELTDFTSSFGLGGLNTSLIIDRIYFFAGIAILLAILGVCVALIYYARKRNKDHQQPIKIGWWEEVGEHLEPSFQENVEEIIIPGTILRIFYGRKRNIWLPRFSRGVAKNLYYVAKTKNGQMVNFALGNLTHNLKEAKLEFDHTDMLWAAENSREFIKKNYTDKSITWWQLYQQTISTAALIFIFTLCFLAIIYFMRGIVTDIGGVAGQLGSVLEKACISAQGSGITSA